MPSGLRMAARMAARGRLQQSRATYAAQSKAYAAQQAFIGPPSPGAMPIANPGAGLSPGSFAGPYAAAQAGAAAGAIASNYAAAMSSGRPFQFGANMGSFGTMAGAGLGFMLGGPMGSAIGSGIGGQLGQLGQSIWSGHIEAQQNAALASVATGIPVQNLLGAAQYLGGLQTPYGASASGLFGGYQALGQLAPALGGGMPESNMVAMAGSLIRRLGPADQAAFRAAAGALGPALIDPGLSSIFGNAISNTTFQSIPQAQTLLTGVNGPLESYTPGSLGLRGVMGALNRLGPMGAFAAIAATGDTAAKDLFKSVNAEMIGTGLNTQNRGIEAETGSIDTQMAMLTGRRSSIRQALADEGGFQTSAAAAAGTEEAFYNRGVVAGDPYSVGPRDRAENLRRGRELRAAQTVFSTATMGPDASWINRTAQVRTDIAIGGMDPFFPYVPPSAFNSIIAQDTTRLAQIAEQTRNNPAAAAATSGERSALQIERAQAMNAQQSGIFGQIMSISAGQPTGFSGWGLGGMSAAALQRRVPGAPLGLGGSGEVSAGQLTETNRLLERLIIAVEGNRGFGGGGGTGGSSPFSLAPRAANQIVGP